MKFSIIKSLTIAAVGIVAITLGGTATALEKNACQQTTPPADYVEITGAAISCDPATQFCCEINNGGGSAGDSCTATSPYVLPDSRAGKYFTVFSKVEDTGELSWSIIPPVPEDPDNATLVDGYRSAGASGGSNCFYGSEPDQNGATGAGYVKNNGQYSGVQKVIFFSDGVNEFDVPPLPPVPNCEIDAGGEGTVKDVGITCPSGTGALGSNERWIIVADVRNPDGVKNIDSLLGFLAPGGGVDASSFCKCNNKYPDVDGQPQCNPNIFSTGDIAGDGPYAGLEPCTLTPEALPTPVVIELQNPTCVGAGGSRYCW